jgi:hypothetical protein
MIYGGPGFLTVVMPTPSTLSHQYARPATHRKAEAESLLTGGKKGVGEEPNHTTAEKAWSSINHSILSAEKHLLFSSG